MTSCCSLINLFDCFLHFLVFIFLLHFLVFIFLSSFFSFIFFLHFSSLFFSFIFLLHFSSTQQRISPPHIFGSHHLPLSAFLHSSASQPRPPPSTPPHSIPPRCRLSAATLVHPSSHSSEWRTSLLSSKDTKTGSPNM